MRQPRLFSTPIGALAVACYLVEGRGWTVVWREARDGSAVPDGPRDVYEGLTWGEALDVISACLDSVSPLQPDGPGPA